MWRRCFWDFSCSLIGRWRRFFCDLWFPWERPRSWWGTLRLNSVLVQQVFFRVPLWLHEAAVRRPPQTGLSRSADPPQQLSFHSRPDPNASPLNPPTGRSRPGRRTFKGLEYFSHFSLQTCKGPCNDPFLLPNNREMSERRRVHVIAAAH